MELERIRQQLGPQEDSLAERIRALHIKPTPSSTTSENVLDFRNSHLIFDGLDLNISRVSSRDFVEGNRFGSLIGALMVTTNESEITARNFHNNPDGFTGLLLTDRNKSASPVGHIFRLRYDDPDGTGYTLQPIYVTVHPDYRGRKLSKVLRLMLLHDSLIQQSDSHACKNILVIPYGGAREQIYPLFKELDPNLIEQENSPLKARYTINPDTVRRNLGSQFKKLQITVTD